MTIPTVLAAIFLAAFGISFRKRYRAYNKLFLLLQLFTVIVLWLDVWFIFGPVTIIPEIILSLYFMTKLWLVFK